MAAFETWSFDKPCKSMSSRTALSEVEVVSGSNGDDSIVNNEGFDLIIVCHYADSELPSEPKVMDDKAADVLSKFLEESREDYKAKLGSATPTLRMMDPETKKCKRYVVVGLGDKDDAQDDKTMGRSLGKAIAMKCTEEAAPQVRNAVLVLPERLPSDNCYKDLSASFYSYLYTDNRFRGTLHTIKKPNIAANHLKRLEVWPFAAGVQDDMDAGKAIAKGVCLSRDIVNAPHNVLNSLSLADLARTIAAESTDGCITCQVLDKDECEKRGMGAYLGVARASETPPQFIHLTYTPPNGTIKKSVGVVGKGLLFDTGGYNIKTAMMELMKFDCGGAAAVLGAATIIGSLQPEGVECHFVVAACENMINDRGIVPSDVLVASNGVTIEVANTDAEGRLTLADALVYCDKELGCEKIIELSTLTGACMVALGKVRSTELLCLKGDDAYCLFLPGFHLPTVHYLS